MTLPSLLRTPAPEVAVEIAADRVTAVLVTGSSPSRARITAHAIEPLPAGAVTPALNASNIPRPDEVTQAIRRAWSALGLRPKRVALTVPDGTAKVSFVRFATVPARTADLDEMVRFQVRKAAPFRVEDAQISYAPGLATPEGQEFVVVQARRDIVAEYERVCADAGAHAGAVGLATFGVCNAVLASGDPPSGDWLLIHLAAEGAALAILRGPHMVFFRHRAAEGDGHLAELVHQTTMYYQDRLGGSGFARALVSGTLPEDAAGLLRRSIETRLGRPVEPVDPTRSIPLVDRPSASRTLIDAITPSVGTVLAQRT